MTRALVLGGGGPVGIAWETGLAVGLAKVGVDLSVADKIVGTSAGSVVGARLALGQDLAAEAERVYNPSSEVTSGGSKPATPPPAPDLSALMEAMAAAASWEGPPEQGRAKLGRFALAQETMSEEQFFRVFADLAGKDWPASFNCTAVHATTGDFVVWDQASGVDLQIAVASSCSVPGIFPPVTIGDARYIDGGMRSALNADVAVGHDIALVISVSPLTQQEIDDPRYLRLQAAMEAEFSTLRDSGTTVTTIEPGPDLLEISGMGMFLMDSSRGPAAYAAGLAQAAQEAERVAAAWL